AGIKKVGVFVNAAADEILEQTKKFALDAVQLHGNESPALCRELCQQGLEVIKVFRVGDSLNLADLQPFVQVVDYFLFDTQGKQYGGNGQVFDWQLLKNYSFPVPIILSGGITVASLATLSQLRHLPIYAIDVNSRFETAPGLKSTAALEKLFQHPIFSGQSIQS
ncbi:MAG: phosphoribosylanthranilate isomerase, partial [Bacteroidetes bacterium]|nr:phosphoribosylanthranilate isomerase [Bacteroidota bacterium]